MDFICMETAQENAGLWVLVGSLGFFALVGFLFGE